VNRYFMDEIGSISFVPYIGVILVVPIASNCSSASMHCRAERWAITPIYT